MRPLRPTNTTAPGVSLRAIDSSTASSIFASRMLDIPTDSGEAGVSFADGELRFFLGLCAIRVGGMRSAKQKTEIAVLRAMGSRKDAKYRKARKEFGQCFAPFLCVFAALCVFARNIN